MVLIDKSHEFLEAVLGLEPLLLGLSMTLGLLSVHLMLVLITILSIIELDLDSDQVLVHTLNHMLILPLHHHLVLMSVVDAVKDILSIAKTRLLVAVLILNSCFICLGLFEFSLHTGTRTDIEVFESGEVMLTCLILSSYCFSRTVLWMLSYF